MTEMPSAMGSGEALRIPDDISGLVDEIRSRAEQRSKAIAIMFKKADAATTDAERMKWLTLVMQFVSIDKEFRNRYPELFSEDERTLPT